MLVFISDLHFVDETAGEHNAPPEAFEKFFRHLKKHAENAHAEQLKIVLLGDIFDLLRTEQWFSEEVMDRPWGGDTEKMRARAGAILDSIAKCNQDTFQLFQPEALRERFGQTAVEPVYIPGNHDRLCWQLPQLKTKVGSLLGLNPENGENFQHHFRNEEHSVYALHGHAFDKFNYEGGSSRSSGDYGLVPIGDPITTELVARLPYRLMEKVDEAGELSAQGRRELRRNFEEIENVRPMSATPRWLLYQIEANRDLKRTIEETIDEVVSGFGELSFVRQWYGRHRGLDPFSPARKLRGVLGVVDRLNVLWTGRLIGFAELIGRLWGKDGLVEDAKKLLGQLDSGIQFVVMGHTHNPLKKAMSVVAGSGQAAERVYLNTGTWRKRFHKCEVGSGFIGWLDMTYVMLYTREEEEKKKKNGSGFPVFETWTGSLKREPKRGAVA